MFSPPVMFDGVDGYSTIEDLDAYDLVIHTQEEFDAMFNYDNLVGRYHSVCLCGEFTLHDAVTIPPDTCITGVDCIINIDRSVPNNSKSSLFDTQYITNYVPARAMLENIHFKFISFFKDPNYVSGSTITIFRGIDLRNIKFEITEEYISAPTRFLHIVYSSSYVDNFVYENKYLHNDCSIYVFVSSSNISNVKLYFWSDAVIEGTFKYYGNIFDNCENISNVYATGNVCALTYVCRNVKYVTFEYISAGKYENNNSSMFSMSQKITGIRDINGGYLEYDASKCLNGNNYTFANSCSNISCVNYGVSTYNTSGKSNLEFVGFRSCDKLSGCYMCVDDLSKNAAKQISYVSCSSLNSCTGDSYSYSNGISNKANTSGDSFKSCNYLINCYSKIAGRFDLCNFMTNCYGVLEDRDFVYKINDGAGVFCKCTYLTNCKGKCSIQQGDNSCFYKCYFCSNCNAHINALDATYASRVDGFSYSKMLSNCYSYSAGPMSSFPYADYKSCEVLNGCVTGNTTTSKKYVDCLYRDTLTSL